MKVLKFLQLIGLMTLFINSSISQTIVNTTPEHKKAVLEEFTGIHCSYCPDGHEIAAGILTAHPNDFFIIAVHAGGYSTPSAGESDFRTAFGNVLAAQAGVTGYPSGTVSRHIFSGNIAALGRGSWSGATNQILGENSYVNVGVEVEIDKSTRIATLHIEAYYTGDSPESLNRLNIAVLQDSTYGPQSNGGSNYNHMHRLIDMPLGQWGEEIEQTSQGTFVDKSIEYVIPANHRGVPVILEHLQFVAFVTETHQEIISANGCYPTLVGVQPTNDIALSKIVVDEMICDGEFTPSIIISNFGTNELTSLDINYTINSEATNTYHWTGNLTSLDTTSIELPTVTYTPQGDNLFVVTIASDNNDDNNSKTAQIADAKEGITWVNLQFFTDNNGNEFSWKLKNSNNDVVESGNSYENNETYTFNFDLSPDCYKFELNDYGEDGGTSVSINDVNTTLYNIENNWGAKRLARFKTISAAVTIDANPQSGTTGLSPDSYIYIIFDQPVRFINDNPIPIMNPNLPVSFKDVDNNDVTVSLFMNPEKTILTIKPQQDLESDKEYSVILGGGVIENNYDMEIENNFTLSFTTGVLGTDEIDNDVIVFPNPAQDVISISNVSNSSIYIYSILGNLIFSTENKENTCTIDISKYKQGNYIIKIKYDDKIISKKFNIL